MSSSPDNKYRLDDLMPIFRHTLARGKSVRFGPQGTSMLPLIRQGIDYVELSPLPQKLKKYDLPLYQRRDGLYVLHRIVEVGDTYTCIGDNQFAIEPGVTHDQMIAVATAIYRGDKRISVDSFSYRLYCRLWHGFRPIRRFFIRCWRFVCRRIFHMELKSRL